MLERLTWKNLTDFDNLNQGLRKRFDGVDQGLRVAVTTLTASQKYDPPAPDALALIDTSGLAGALTVTLPPVQTVPGYRLQFLLIDATHGVVLKDSTGATLTSWSTLHVAHTYVSDGRAWYQTQ